MLRLNEQGLGTKISSDAISREISSRPRLMERIWAGIPEGDGSLGWLSVDAWAGQERLREVRAAADSLRARADTLVLIGVGGSNNAARSVLRALGTKDAAHRVVYAGNTLSPYALNALLDDLEGHEVALYCVAKNFKTLEPGSSFRLLRQWLTERVGAEEACRRIVCNGTPGSDLEKLCLDHGWGFTAFPPDIGGRYTALSPTHLLPLAFAGVDIEALAEGGKEEEDELRRAADTENPALRYAMLRSLAWEAGLRIELLAWFEPRLSGIGLWWQQLFAESEGKDGKGLFPATAEYSEELHSLGQYVQDGTRQILETFLNVAEAGPKDSLVLGGSDCEDGFGYLDDTDFRTICRTSFEATRAAHSQVLPCPTIEIDRVDERDLGRLFYFFMLSCYISAVLLGVNPFDQPGVEAYKQLMHHALGRID